MAPVLEMNDVSWKREGKTILDRIHWQVQEKEHWALLGLNGSGKTTILNMINGYIWPTTGRIAVLGHPFGTVDLRELRKSIGWVSSALQERIHSKDDTLSVVMSGKHAWIGMYEEPHEEDKEKAAALMTQLGCRHLLKRPYRTCSQGEKQKLLIARALMASPKLLILDEASSGLDFLAREALLASIHELLTAPDAPTMLFVTHHIEEILPDFTKTFLLRSGQVFAQGETCEVLNGDTLSSLFETNVEVTWKNDRAWLSLP